MISGSKPKRFAVSWGSERARELAAHRFVAGLHVGEVQIRQHVAVRREQLVADGVPVVQHAVRPAEEARAEARVGAAVEDRLEQRRANRAGSYSRSASCTMTMSPVLIDSAWRIAAPLPRFSGWRYSWSMRPCASSVSRISCVPSVERSSTQMISFGIGVART